MILRAASKRVVERLLRVVRGQPRRMAGRALILAYHNVVPAGQPPVGDRPLHLPLPAFRRQLDLLQEHCDLVAFPDILRAAGSARPQVAITFDDAYHGAMTLALPELARRGVPVTVFLAPGRFGAASFWWDSHSTEQGLPAEVRERALVQAKGREAEIGTGPTPLPLSHSCATEAVVRAAVQQGVTYGAHTWTHPNLAQLDGATLEEELRRPLQWLEQSGLPMIRYVAYPYGLVNPAAASAAERLGYVGGLLVEGGWISPAVTPFAIPRYNVPAGLSDDGLILRLSGAIAA